ncbi:MAG: hypothetical protein SNF33_00335 (plasmid) [Candidatus Algichlamydia australiensis]|nr:hypothetical protein [Chlamydiales bacterium]
MATLGYHIVGRVPSANPIVFCNGIMNKPDEANASAESISNIFGGKRVIVKHNPTDFPSYLDFRVREDEEARLSRELAILINQLVEDKDHLVLFAHSHGVVISDRALQQLSRPVRRKIRVYTFGGASVIPKRLAGVAKNFVFKDDLIARVGNINSQRPSVLYSMNLVNGELGKMSLDDAINKWAYRSLCNKIPIGSPKYNTIVREGNPEAIVAHPKYWEELSRYKGYFDKYDVTFLDGEEFQTPAYKPLKKHSSNIFEFYQTVGINIFRGIAAFGANAFKNHEFSSYLPQIIEIARAHPE